MFKVHAVGSTLDFGSKTVVPLFIVSKGERRLEVKKVYAQPLIVD